MRADCETNPISPLFSVYLYTEGFGRSDQIGHNAIAARDAAAQLFADVYAPQRSGVPVFSSKNSVYSRGCSAGSNHCTSSDNSLYTATRDEEYVIGRDWNICSFAAQECLQWHW
jgi:hypothetical protein